MSTSSTRTSNLLPQSQLRGAELFLLTVAFMVIIILYLHQPDCRPSLRVEGEEISEGSGGEERRRPSFRCSIVTRFAEWFCVRPPSISLPLPPYPSPLRPQKSPLPYPLKQATNTQAIITHKKCYVTSQLIEWNSYEGRQTPLLYVFIDLTGHNVRSRFSTIPISREVKHHVYVKRQTQSFPFACRLLFIISTHKLVISRYSQELSELFLSAHFLF